jgi:hypothetical protein
LKSTVDALHLALPVAAPVAFSVVHADNITAAWAPISRFLTFQERLHALDFQHFQVFNHAHAVVFPVAIVKVSEVLARHSVAFKAVLDSVAGEFFAVSFDVAVFGSRTASCTVGHLASLPWYTMGVSDVGFAYAAVHAARSNKLGSEQLLGHG